MLLPIVLSNKISETKIKVSSTSDDQIGRVACDRNFPRHNLVQHSHRQAPQFRSHTGANSHRPTCRSGCYR